MTKQKRTERIIKQVAVKPHPIQERMVCMKKLYHVNYTTLDVTGIQKIKVIASCENEAIQKVKDFVIEDVKMIKVTKSEKVLD